MSTRHEIRTTSSSSSARQVVPRADNRLLRILLGVLILPMAMLGIAIGTAAPAAAVGGVSSTVSTTNGFPAWYQDSAGNRVEQCLDPNDANCVVLASATYNPANPTVFPSNFPDEFFYALADSDNVATPGCLGTSPGRASVRLAVEGAFINGAPAAADRMVFGRIRVKVTSGLCPNTAYQFRHPFGTITLTTNAAGAIPANVGTEDIGCVPTPTKACTFTTATSSRVFGTSAAGGFLRWDPAVAPAAPAGYLGDGAATLHAITGGTNGNAFRILSSSGVDTGMGTSLFGVAGKLAGSLVATPEPVDLGGVALGSAGTAKTITITNVDRAAVTLGTPTLSSTEFALTGGNCTIGRSMTRDASCTFQVRFTPTGLAGRRSATLSIPSTGGVRSPLVVNLTAAATNVGDAPTLSLSSTSLAFGSVRLRTASPVQHLVVTNTGRAPLGVSDVSFDPATMPEPDQYRVLGDTCSTGAFVDPGLSCTIDVQFAPFVSGVHGTRILLSSNAGSGLDSVALSGTGTGGAAAVSAAIESDGFPEWYRDEAGVKVSACLDPTDPNCIVLADATYDPAKPLVFPTNFPGEFFYQVATSDIVSVNDRTCTTSTGKSFVRSAIEGTFANGDPVDGDQMVFGRIRFSITGGLCPGTEYILTSPYGADSFVTDASGALRRNAGTDDVGCVPAPGAPCDFSDALSSRVLGGVVRWDPAVAPAAPAGYIGDGATLHKITGAPYIDGGTPANYFRITRARDGVVIGGTDQFTVMGKLRGPLEADRSHVAFAATTIGGTSAPETVSFSNTGTSSIDVTEVALSGFDGDDFGVVTDACTGATLAPGAACTVSARFTPTVTGDRSMTLSLRHTGLNDPLNVSLTGVGGAVDTAAAISFAPRSLSFLDLHIGGTSPLQTVTVSNAGGTAPLTFSSPASLSGPGAASFAIVEDRCTAPVDPGSSCQIDVAFTPNAAGSQSASLVVHDNAPGLTHALSLSGRGSAATLAVSGAVDPSNGFPTWYQDANGVRIEPCLDTASGNCIVLADPTYDSAQPLSFPDNFPGEFFYAVADSDLIATPGCAGTTPSTAMLRVALEGSFGGGAPLVGDQTTFGRIRVIVKSGLCPFTPYTFETPYGAFSFTTDANGGFGRNAGTTDVGCGAAPCTFADALASGPASSFLRWSPADGVAPPAGYLGDAVSFHRVVGGTYTRPGESQPVNEFVIADSAGNVVGSTDRFMVSGKIAGPLQSDTASIAFGHSPVGAATASSPVVITNVATSSTTIASVTLTGANPGDFVLDAGTCGGASVPSDSACTVRVAFRPTAASARSAVLRIVPTSGPAMSVPLSGLGDAVAAPAISVTPGVLPFGTVAAPNSTTLSTTVRNTGDAPLLVGAPAISGAGSADYLLAASTCTTPVAPGATCTVSVTFRPTVAGSRTASLTLPHNATGGQTVVSLTGVGSGSTFVISPTTVKFGTVNRGTTKTQSVTVKNSGTVGFRVTAAGITGAQAAFFRVTGGTCVGTTLAAGKTCSVTLSFSPTAAIAYTASVVVTGDSTSLPATASAELQGTGK